MSVPEHLLEGWRAARRGRRSAALLLRHAERGPVTRLDNHEDVRLTERGHQQAQEAGRALASLSAHVLLRHSPIERCAETARGIQSGAEGGGARAQVGGVLHELGTTYVMDKPRAWALVQEHGGRFIREWFDGRLPSEVFVPRAQAARAQLRAVDVVLGDDVDAMHVMITHDWNLAILREELLGITPERTWPDYLDGVVVSRDGDELVVEAFGRVARAPRG